MKNWTEEEKEQQQQSYERFQEAMKNHQEELRGQVIAVNFKKGIVIKSKCRKGRTERKVA